MTEPKTDSPIGKAKDVSNGPESEESPEVRPPLAVAAMSVFKVSDKCNRAFSFASGLRSQKKRKKAVLRAMKESRRANRKFKKKLKRRKRARARGGRR